MWFIIRRFVYGTHLVDGRNPGFVLDTHGKPERVGASRRQLHHNDRAQMLVQVIGRNNDCRAGLAYLSANGRVQIDVPDLKALH